MDRQKNAGFALAILFAVNLMNFFDRQVVGALAEPIRLEFGLSDTALGVVNTLFVLVYAIVGLPLGRLTDTWLRTRLIDRKSTRLNSSHVSISYAVFCL